MIIESFRAEDTFALGKRLGENAKPGDVYTLSLIHIFRAEES